jgi:beta-galactosidase beta subunit
MDMMANGVQKGQRTDVWVLPLKTTSFVVFLPQRAHKHRCYRLIAFLIIIING